MTSRADVLELLRAPASFSAIGDSLVGAYASGPVRPRTLALPVASVLLYSAGMGLNDWADRKLDAQERPERPIPSGRISADTALSISAGLMAAGIGVATLAHGRRGALRASLLAAAIVGYDVVGKPTPAGPAVMAACRALNVLLGAESFKAGAAPALTIAAHTAAVTVLSTHEVHGADPEVPEGVRLAALGVAAVAVAGGRGTHPSQAMRIAGRVAAVGTAARFLSKTIPPLTEAIDQPDAMHVRDAVRAGLGAMIPLQSTLIARTGHLVPAAVVAGLEVVQKQVMKRLKGDTT